MAKPSLTAAEAGVKITRHEESWEANLGTPTEQTYSFRDSGGGAFSRFNNTQIAVTEQILGLWADAAGITFTRVGAGYSNGGTIRFANYNDPDDGSAAYAYYPGAEGWAGDVWYNIGNSGRHPEAGDYDFSTLLHEIGHALGLEHPGNYNGSATYARDAEYRQDTGQYTVMSYFDADHSGADHFAHGQMYYAQTPLLHDIAAIQRLYGANAATRGGNTVYGFNATADRDAYHLDRASDEFVVCIYDRGGADTLDFSLYDSDQRIDLREGKFSDVGALTRNVSIAFGTVIETAIGGAGNDLIVGNAFANTLLGCGGSDILDPNGGDDTVITGSGYDTIRFDRPIGPGNVDTIADFRTGRDTIVLDEDVFTGFGRRGWVSDSRFKLADETLDSNDRLIFDPDDGSLSYDADGSGGAATAIRFATVIGTVESYDVYIIA